MNTATPSPSPSNLSLQEQLTAKDAEIAELKAWKESALAVGASWDCQAVGREMGLTLGKAIHPNILPYIQHQKSEVARLRHVMEEILRELPMNDNFMFWISGIFLGFAIGCFFTLKIKP